MTRFAVFPTPLGWAGLAWGGAGLLAVRLPTRDRARAVAALLKRHPQASEAEPPPEIAAVVADIQALLAGARPDFATARLDLAATPDFDAHVYALARTIPAGQTRTYGELAERLGDRRRAREVGQALGRNPWPIVVPCHRVTAAGGKLGGFSAPGGAATKRRLLEIEGAAAAAQRDLFG